MKQFLHEQQFVEVGFVRKAHGYKGEVKIAVEEPFEEDILNSPFLFIGMDGFMVPFKINSVNTTKDIIIRFDRMDSSSETERIIGKNLFLLEHDIIHAKEHLGNQNLVNKFIDYQIHDKQSNATFSINDIREFPQQIMAVIELKGRELLVPFNDEFIERIDERRKVIYMDLPEGLLEL